VLTVSYCAAADLDRTAYNAGLAAFSYIDLGRSLHSVEDEPDRRAQGGGDIGWPG
jgi:hypothetical protein